MSSNRSTPLTANGTLRIAIQKSGRLSEGSLALLKQMGLGFETYRDRLFAQCRNMSIDILFLRDDDIPEYVRDGVADLGIVGCNILDESQVPVERLLPLDFGYCSLAIAVPEQSPLKRISDLAGKRIATSYPATLARFLKEKQITAEMVLLKGSVEIAPALRVADAICDLVSTGSTLRTNRLTVLETVSRSQAILIGKKNPSTKKQKIIEKLLLRAQGVQEARKYKYIMFNASASALETIKKLVPGCKSPTVVPLADPGFIAVHSVVLEEAFWDVVEKIRECGGSGILVSPVEKFIR
ncbi:MAG: ATP phosphoribosyltransferase [Candidatus Peribacteraceae bacterium]|nr:ATP phosphoribosyltransferase [Candidatus Peribacteraceae bacterium]MDD5742084.1 ATP phosphoribosyltransferase [Candidatus Peribacteraceae bacterium]